MAHLKQVGVATFVLADDNDGWINGINALYSSDGLATIPADKAWYYAVTNYLGKSNALEKQGQSPACPSRDPRDLYWTYGANTFLSGEGYRPMHPLSDVKNPTRIFLVGECYTPAPSSGTHFDNTVVGVTAGNYPRHQNPRGLNFVFVDGHGEFLKAIGTVVPYDQLSPWRTITGAGQWTYDGATPCPSYWGIWAE